MHERERISHELSTIGKKQSSVEDLIKHVASCMDASSASERALEASLAEIFDAIERLESQWLAIDQDELSRVVDQIITLEDSLETAPLSENERVQAEGALSDLREKETQLHQDLEALDELIKHAEELKERLSSAHELAQKDADELLMYLRQLRNLSPLARAIEE